MIGSFKEGETGALCRFYQRSQRSGELPASIENQLRRKLSMLAAASSERSLFQPRSNHYERLYDNLAGWSSIRVNIQGGWFFAGKMARHLMFIWTHININRRGNGHYYGGTDHGG